MNQTSCAMPMTKAALLIAAMVLVGCSKPAEQIKPLANYPRGTILEIKNGVNVTTGDIIPTTCCISDGAKMRCWNARSDGTCWTKDAR